MSELVALCNALDQVIQPLPGLAGELQQRAARLRSLAVEVQIAAREVPDGPDCSRVAAGLYEAAHGLEASANALSAAVQQGRSYIQRTISSANTSTLAAGAGPGLQPYRAESMSVAQSGFASAEFSTSAGSAFYYAWDDTYRSSAQDVRGFAGEYVLDLHGTPDTVQLVDSDGNAQQLDAAQFAQVVRLTAWDGQPIRLFSCDTGRHAEGFAQQLADELGVTVTAPTAPVWWELGGGDIVSDIDWSQGRPRPKHPPTGKWVTFEPRQA